MGFFVLLGRRVVTLLLVLFAALLTAAPNAGAAPSNTTAIPSGGELPTGLPTTLHQFIGGTSQFESAAWSTDCKPGGPSAVPNTDPRFRWLNDAAAPGGVDVGRYLEAATPDLALLSFWAQPQDERVAWWHKYWPFVGSGSYPGDDAAAELSPTAAQLPRFPAETAGGGVQYHWGFCSGELAKWATPADDAIGFEWAQQLDPITIADAASRGFPMTQVEKTPCAVSIDAGVWCSIAYYVDCTKAAPGAETDACVGWNDSIAEQISEDHAWGTQHRSAWQKLQDFASGLASGAATVATGVAGFFADIYNAIKKAIDFITGAADAFDKFVNELKRNAVGLVTAVLQNYNRASAWDPGSAGFLSRYALMAGLGVVLAAFMFLGAIRRALDSGRREESRDLWIRLLKTFGIILWAPALFQLLSSSGTHATADIVSRWTGGEAGGAEQKLSGLNNVTSSIPGGAFMGFVLFLFLFIGALGLWVGLMVQRFGMEVAGTLIALVAGAYVHPRWERKVTTALWVVVGLILAKPLTMIVLGATFGVINEGLSFHGSSTEVLAGLTLATIGVVTAGLAPFSALKWAPILPTSSRSHDHHRGGGGLVSGAILGAAGTSLASRAGAMGRAPARRSGAASNGFTGALAAGGVTAGSGSRLSTTAAARGVAGAAGLPPRLGNAAAALGRGAGARARRTTAGLAATGLAIGTQAAQTGLARGRALADHQTPDVDLAEDLR